jgi:hypothetical protein
MKSKPFSFNVPSEYSTIIRSLVYNRLKELETPFDCSIQDEEDKIGVLSDIVRFSMEEAYKIGYTLGVEEGKRYENK